MAQQPPRPTPYTLVALRDYRPRGITFDTGALIALERRRQHISKVYLAAVHDRVPITVPTAVIAEWWRGRSDVAERILGGVRVEPLEARLSRFAGEAMASVPGATVVDAIVMASAALRGDIVYTSDVADLELLGVYFPAVRVFST